jgi:phage terminase large subunit-like protein
VLGELDGVPALKTAEVAMLRTFLSLPRPEFTELPDEVPHLRLRAIEERIKESASVYNIKEIAFDPWNAKATAQNLTEDGIEMVEFPQNIRNYNEPSQLLERLIRQGQLHHGGNAVLSWMAGNVTAKMDGVGNIMPDRKKSANKIDGIPATIMALARAVFGENESAPVISGM